MEVNSKKNYCDASQVILVQSRQFCAAKAKAFATPVLFCDILLSASLSVLVLALLALVVQVQLVVRLAKDRFNKAC